VEPDKRIVTRMPLVELWTHEGAPFPATRVRWLVSSEAHDLVKQRPDLDLVVARGGERIQWLYGDEKWTFWKEELKGRIADPEGPIYREDFEDELYYLVSEWAAPGIERPILLAEKHD
jgi:hypothetical protein